MTWWEEIKSSWNDATVIASASQSMSKAATETELEGIWIGLTGAQQKDLYLSMMYQGRKKEFGHISKGLTDPLEIFMSDALNEWLGIIKKYEGSDPANAKQNLIALSSDVMKIAGTTAAIDIGLGMLPNSAGEASATNTKQMLAWLGFGAILAAVAHDPVKIGLLRPYQDSLEQTFRNRRPDSGDLFLAYQQRSLSATKIEDVTKITDTLMTTIEGENEKFYDTEISKWGYSVIFSNALKDASTKTLSFGNLMALAKQGRLNRGMAIYSLWGYGLDRRLMKTALEALDQANEVANYEGFRAQIEPAYIEGILTETELKDYWNKIHVPADVIASMLPRFKKKREAYILNNNAGAPAKERDLTVSQLQSAYQNLLLDRAAAQNSIITLGYSLAEAKIFLDLAELRRKLPSAQTLKKLPLSDYEKAYKNGLIDENKVLSRMAGEYTADDIALEKALLKIGKA
jgi:hypothetical protein